MESYDNGGTIIRVHAKMINGQVASLPTYRKGPTTMSYTRKDFGARLKKQLTVDYDVVKVARWAHKEYLDHCRELEADLVAEITKIIAMEEGPEFELTKEEIQLLADELQK